MHKFLRAVGFSTYQTKKEIKKLFSNLIKEAKTEVEFHSESEDLCQLCMEVSSDMGICIVGEKNENG